MGSLAALILPLLFFLCPFFLLFLLLLLIVRPRPIKIPIKGQHVFITGGSSGIGLELARQVASEGAQVTILARNLDKLKEAKMSIRLATGVDVAIYSADVRDYEAVKRAVEDAGLIDVLVCNQGIFVPNGLEIQDLEEVKSMIDVNLMGTFNLITAALPGMKKDRHSRGPASIAIMSSMGGQIGVHSYTGYAASKFGLRGLAEALQQEVIADNIHVTLIHPPDTDTPGFVTDLERRSELTSIIVVTSIMKADLVAKRALEGIKAAKFIVYCNFEGLMMSLATAGLSPQRSVLMAFVEVLLGGFMRFLGLITVWNIYRSIEKWHAQHKEKLQQPLLS